MTIEEIRQSNLLEDYVLGLLSEKESQRVKGFLIDFPELQKDYFEIQKSLEEFAQAKAIIPDPNLQSKIFDAIKKDGDKTVFENPNKIDTPLDTSLPKKGIGLVGLLLGGLSLIALWFAWNKSNEYKNLKNSSVEQQLVCDSINQSLQDKIDLFESLNSAENRTLNMTPTEKFPETQLLFHINNRIRQNYIQVKNLPNINQGQAFQLWALKDGLAPIPLTVFRGDDVSLIPVDFEDGTTTYAITIEVSAGATSPDLSNLIGTVGV